jgi:hypothetical protein
MREAAAVKLTEQNVLGKRRGHAGGRNGGIVARPAHDETPLSPTWLLIDDW